MTTYSAFSESGGPFDSLEGAVASIMELPWMDRRSVRAVSMVSQRHRSGIEAEVVSGVAAPDAPGTLVYLVEVGHQLLGETIPVEYLIEFGEADNGEDGEGTDGIESEPGDEEGAEEFDGGAEQGGAEYGDLSSGAELPHHPAG